MCVCSSRKVNCGFFVSSNLESGEALTFFGRGSLEEHLHRQTDRQREKSKEFSSPGAGVEQAT